MPGIYVDANLLVLRIVGDVSRQLIHRHRRLRTFTPEDYDKLIEFTSRYDCLLVTPNTLTETSNLLAYGQKPRRSELMEKLRSLIHESREIVVSSTAASAREEFVRLGLTDTALLEHVSNQTPLLTADLQLYLAALDNGDRAAFNFTQFRFYSLDCHRAISVVNKSKEHYE